MVGIIILLLIYTVGFPLICFIVLMRAFADEKTGGCVGSLRSRFKCCRGKKYRKFKGVIIHAPKNGGRKVVQMPASEEIEGAGQKGDMKRLPSTDGWVQAPTPNPSPPPTEPALAEDQPTPAQLAKNRQNTFGELSGLQLVRTASP
jgi:hypothetical protein